MNPPVLALDVGGTKLAAGLVTSDGEVTGVRRVATPPGSPQVVFDALVNLAEGVFHEARSPALQGIGVAYDASAWDGFPLLAGLEQRHADLPVRLCDAALCCAVAEHWRGAGSGSADMLGVTVSDTVGGGLILDGRLAVGGTGNAGRIGHVVVDPVGPVCTCGGIGCLETLVALPRVVAWAREHGWVAAGSAAAPELAASARAGDPVAAAALALAGSALGIAIASAAALLDLDLVVVGGGLAEAGDVLLGPLRRAVERHLCVPYGRRLEVLASGVGPDAALVGAAALVHDGAAYWPG
ncbi:ROK family protein [Acidothermaceae bacterium B102]|nr:ROK family protein [Acidothermaceae bacterium B102]